MRRNLTISYFVHSVRSDWNNGNAHFQRGLARALARMGHQVTCFEPQHSWSLDNLLSEPAGPRAVEQFSLVCPDLNVATYQPSPDQLSPLLRDTDIVIVHEWNGPELVSIILELRDQLGFRTIFHDTHHRASSSPARIAELQVARFDGVLAFGNALRDIYRSRFGLSRVWTLHEAADTTIFAPGNAPTSMDVVWIGNWGDDERSREICEFLIRPASQLRDRHFHIYGVRYPQQALDSLRDAGVSYGGYLSNLDAPDIYHRALLTIHIPRQQYCGAMTGIPTIRVFEALAAGIPLISAPWTDAEHLFCPGDFLTVTNTEEMVAAVRYLLDNPSAAQEQAARGLHTILRRHTCAHRAEELTSVCEELLSA